MEGHAGWFPQKIAAVDASLMIYRGHKNINKVNSVQKE